MNRALKIQREKERMTKMRVKRSSERERKIRLESWSMTDCCQSPYRNPAKVNVFHFKV